MESVLKDLVKLDEQTIREKAEKFFAEFIANYHEWKMSDLIRWMTEDDEPNRKIKTAIALLALTMKRV